MDRVVLRIAGRQGRVIAAASVGDDDLLLRTEGLVAARLNANRFPREKIQGADGTTRWAYRLDPALVWEVSPWMPDLERQLREVRPDWFVWLDAEIERHRLIRERRDRLARLSGAGSIGKTDSHDDYDNLPVGHPWHSLRPYQQAGVRWLTLTDGRTLLGDDMGLGKTPQTLVYLSLSGAQRIAIVCPSVVVLNWEREAQRWAPDLRFVAIRSLADMRALLEAPPDPPYAVSVSWGLLRLVRQSLGELGIDTVVADEVHYAGNRDSQRTRALLWLGTRICTRHRIGLTGTEVRNRPKELWPLLRFVDPLRFRVFERFGERFCGPRWKQIGNRKIREYEGSSKIEELNRLLRGYCLRRSKAKVLSEVPSKVRQVLFVPYGEIEQRKVRHCFDQIKKKIGLDGSSDQLWAMGQLTKMRREAGLAKVDAAIDWIQEATSNGEPVVVFLHHQEVREALEAGLDKHGIQSVAIVGSTPAAKRQAHVDAFMDGKVDVIIGSTAMKEGVTLTRARFSLHVERFWVPADEEQAEDRICRIGQTRGVVNVYLHLEGSLDDYVARIIEDKRQILDALHDRSMEQQLLALLGAT